MYPPGIAGTAPGPWLGLQEQASLVPLATPLLVTPANPTGAITNPLNGVTSTTNDLPSAVIRTSRTASQFSPAAFRFTATATDRRHRRQRRRH